MTTDPHVDFQAASTRFREAVSAAVALPTHAGAIAATDAAIEEYNRAVDTYNAYVARYNQDRGLDDDQDDEPLLYLMRNGHAATLGAAANAPDLCPRAHQTLAEEDACDRLHLARGGLVGAETVPILDGPGCDFTLPPRADIEAQAGQVRLRRRTPEESRAYLIEHRDEQLAKGVPAEVIDALIEATYDRSEPEQ